MGIMTVSTLTSSTWNFTCKFCSVIRNAFAVAFVAIIAFGEQAGRSRAASELSRMGLHDEAKALMTQPLDYDRS
jgi:hypothetical protein